MGAVGNEIFYCTECGTRASGSDFAPGTSGFGAERSCCPACLGLPVVSRRESTKKIRKPPPGAATAIAVPPAPPPNRALGFLVGFAVVAIAGTVAMVATAPAPSAPRNVILLPPPVPPPVPAPVVPEPPPPRQEELPRALEEKRGTALRPAAPEPADPELEAQADAAYGELEEAATALADEGRVGDALARIRAFPAHYRDTRAWKLSEALKRRIEQRAR